MKAVEYIAENIDPMKVLDYYHFREVKESGSQIRSCCEIHKGNNPTAFIWNKSNNLWYCYTGDCHGGDVFTLIQKMENVDFITSVKKAADILGLNITGMKIERQANLVIENTRKWLDFMKKKKHIANATDNFASYPNYQLPFTKYYDEDDRFTRFSQQTLQHYNARFCKVYPTDDGLLYNKLVIPIEMNGVNHGVALRDVTGQYNPKWLYQPKGIEIRTLLYNFDKAIEFAKQHKQQELILVEGIFDVWAYHNIGLDNVVAIFGSSLKQEQTNILLKSGFDLTLSFDNDDAGNKCSDKVTKELKYKVDLKKITLPKGNDPADCSEETLKECYLIRQ